MYEENLKKLQNVGMRLTVPKSVLQSVVKVMDRHLETPKARGCGDIDIFDLEKFFRFITTTAYREFFVDVFEREFNDHACSLIVMRSMVISMIESRWQTHPSIYFAARRAQLIEFYGIV